ncbi:MAG: C1 family peptidase [Bacteroidia bacterium]
MKTKLTLVALCILAGFSASGQKYVRLTQANTQQTIHVQQDQALEIQLPGQPSTGYGWYVKTNSKTKVANLLHQEGNWDFVPSPASKGPGGEGTQVIHYTALTSGQVDVELVYERPWLGEGSATSNFKVTVITDGKYNGVPVPVNTTSTTRTVHSNPSTSSVPSSFSWLTQGSMTPIKDQGQCGSCWSFAANGSFESVIKYWDNVTRSLSEQWLINCDANCSGCNGGWCPDDMFQTYGCVYESDLPYTAAGGTCASSYTYHERITSHAQVNGSNPTDAEIKQAIYDYGPVWAGIDAGNNFQNYSGGVFNSSDGTSIDHAIVLCGWDDTQGCWILRNSWNTTWGENGYMRIAYGTSGVGASAEYLVYRGMISHSVPPVAAMSVNTTNSCSGAVQFTDQSSNTPSSWLWDFGDGTTSTLQNPSHTYASSGTFTVKLKATNSFGNNTATNSNYVTVSMLSAPTTTGATRVGPGVVNLSATASGTPTLNWYTAATGGTPVNTGPTYSPTISNTTTYYVADEPVAPSSHLGLANNSAGGGYYTANTDRRLYFSVLSQMVLQSVTIYANTAGNRQIEILDNTGASVALSAVFNATTGTNVVPLNITLAPGTGYAIKLAATSAMDLFRNNAGCTYPYTVSGLASIDSSDASGATLSYYYYFYNWVVSAPSCASPRASVTGVVSTATGIQNNAVSTSFRVYPNPNNGMFTLEGLDTENTVEIFDMVGKVVMQTVSVNPKLSVDLSGNAKGLYFYRVMNKNTKETHAGKIVVN